MWPNMQQRSQGRFASGALRDAQVFLDESLAEAILKRENPVDIFTKFKAVYHSSINPPYHLVQVIMVCFAVECKYYKLLEFLIQENFPLNDMTGDDTRSCGTSPIHIAAAMGDKQMIQTLLEAGANVAYPPEGFDSLSDPKSKGTVLDFAAKLDDVELFLMLTELYKVSLNHNARTPLHVAAQQGAAKCLEHLLKENQQNQSQEAHKVYVNSLDLTHVTPLMLCVPHGLKCFQMLIDHGADQTLSDKGQCTCLHWALKKSSYPRPNFITRELPELLADMLSKGVDPNQSNYYRDIPLSMLCTQISSRIQRQDQMMYKFPYSLEEHTKTVIKSLQVLIDHGAKLNEEVSFIPLSSILEEIYFCCSCVIGLQSNDPSSATALESIKDTIRMANTVLECLFSNGANPSVFIIKHRSRAIDLVLRNLMEEETKILVPDLEETLRLFLAFGSQNCNFRLLTYMAKKFIRHQEYQSFISTALGFMNHKEFRNCLETMKLLFDDPTLIQVDLQPANQNGGNSVPILPSPNLDPIFVNFVQFGLKTPRALSQQCRVVIHKAMNRKPQLYVKELNLPYRINKFVLGELHAL